MAEIVLKTKDGFSNKRVHSIAYPSGDPVKVQAAQSDARRRNNKGRRMKKLPYLILFAGLLVGCQTTEPLVPAPQRPKNFIVDLTAVAGKKPSAVEKVLGKPSKDEKITNQSKRYPKKYYRGDSIEIVYVRGVADWIFISGEYNIAYGEEALAQLGLPKKKPTFKNPIATIRWEHIPKIKEVNLFPGKNGKCSYAYILVNTSP